MVRDVERGAPLDVSCEGFAGRLEVLTGPTGRARRSDEAKARIVAESWAPGTKVADVARRHGTTRWQVYKWRQLAKRGELPFPPGLETPAFAAVVVEEERPPAAAGSVASPGPAVVEIEVRDVVIRASEAVGADHLARAIRAALLATT